ncbi:MAG: ATP-binding cassette domain-containing protein [Actinomycetota bacterium]
MALEEREELGWRARRWRNLRQRWQLVRMLGTAPPGLVSATILAASAAGLLPVGLILAGGSLTARIQGALARGGPPRSLHAVYWAFALVLGLFLAGEVMVPLQGRLRRRMTSRIDGAARDRLMSSALSGVDLTRLHDPEYSAAMRRARGLVWYSATPGWGAGGMVGLFRDYLTGLAAAVVVARYQPALAVLSLLVALVGRVMWHDAVIRIVDIWIEGVPSFREADYFTELGLGRTAAHEVRLFGLTDWLRRRIHAAGIRGWTPTWEQRAKGIGPNTAIHLLLTGSVSVAVLVWAARVSARGDLGVAGLVVVVPALFAVVALARTFDDDVAVHYGAVTLPALELIDRRAARTIGREAGTRVPSADRPPSVELRGVSFRYPFTDEPVLRGVDLEIPGGTTTALVGMNGAGKTTLVRLLCGLYPPVEGSVLVDGVDLSEYDVEAWHGLIAPMFQEFVRLPASVAENAAAGAVEHLGDEAGIAAVLAEAGGAGFAARLPQGADSLLATRYADGTDLSGGQWQRLGIARALFALRHGARLLLLDEPTSNLDTPSEERLVRRLVGETRGTATVLLVTHRLALARRCDQIVVLERGRVVERGTHDELVRLGGRYADAFGMQAALYPLEEPGA